MSSEVDLGACVLVDTNPQTGVHARRTANMHDLGELSGLIRSGGPKLPVVFKNFCVG